MIGIELFIQKTWLTASSDSCYLLIKVCSSVWRLTDTATLAILILEYITQIDQKNQKNMQEHTILMRVLIKLQIRKLGYNPF